VSLSKLSQETISGKQQSPFHAALGRLLAGRGMSASEVCPVGDLLARRLIEEYGAMFVAADSVHIPPRCVFESEEEVERFQREAGWRAEDFEGVRIELQPAAMDSLVEARADVEARGLTLTPRDGREAARRGFDDTLRLWESRCRPAIEYWSEQGRLSPRDAECLRGMTVREQVAAVLAHEESGLFFSKDFTKSILQSVAAPGASQHLAMLAFDAVEFQDPRLRRVLARHGWFQTVLSDLPHFTFLGVSEEELPARGLKRIDTHGQTFWVPDLEVRG
jgi:hypothetical protein